MYKYKYKYIIIIYLPCPVVYPPTVRNNTRNGRVFTRALRYNITNIIQSVTRYYRRCVYGIKYRERITPENPDADVIRPESAQRDGAETRTDRATGKSGNFQRAGSSGCVLSRYFAIQNDRTLVFCKKKKIIVCLFCREIV